MRTSAMGTIDPSSATTVITNVGAVDSESHPPTRIACIGCVNKLRIRAATVCAAKVRTP